MMMINKYIACTALAAFAVCKTVLAEDEYLHQSASDWDMRIADVKLLSKDIAVGQYATFGSFEQDSLGDDGKEPIVWLVADKKDSKALLVSRYSLDILPFNEKFAVADWEHSTARAWLAHYFLINAFSQKERAKIVLTDVSNQGDETNGIPNQPSTKDFVFLLSAEEAKVYLKDGGFMKAAPTPDAALDSGIVGSKCGAECDTSENLKAIPWWTRTKGAWVRSCVVVEADGSLNMKGYAIVTKDEIGIRPAMWVTLE